MPRTGRQLPSRLRSLFFDVLRIRAPQLLEPFDLDVRLDVNALARSHRGAIQSALGDELFETGFALPGNEPSARDLDLEELIDLFGPLPANASAAGGSGSEELDAGAADADAAFGPDELFASAVRLQGDAAGVFEFDGETSWFYLLDLRRPQGHQIVDHIHVVSGPPGFTRAEVSVQWDEPQELVALCVRGAPWAVYDLARRAKYGGDIVDRRAPELPAHVAVARWQAPAD